MLRKNLVELEGEKAALTIRHDKGVRDYEKLSARLLETEKRKREVRWERV